MRYWIQALAVLFYFGVNGTQGATLEASLSEEAMVEGIMTVCYSPEDSLGIYKMVISDGMDPTTVIFPYFFDGVCFEKGVSVPTELLNKCRAEIQESCGRLQFMHGERLVFGIIYYLGGQ
jgi:hypothetical protein